MQRFISKLLEPFHGLRVRISRSGPDTATIDGDGNENALRRAQIEVTEGRAPKRSSPRGRLDGLASFRIHPTAIIFTSDGSHGSGGKGDVARATFRRDNGSDERVVAVKKLRYHRGTDQKKFSNEFVHEVEILAGLSHDNIVELIGFVEDLENGKAWLVLSWEPNGNVSEFLTTGRWEIPERVSLIKDTFEGVMYLHRHQPPICHGDLKSLNILISSSYRAIITDFGSARTITESEYRATDEEHDRQAQQNPTTEQTRPQIHVGAVGNQLTLTGPAWSLRWAPPKVVNGKRPSLSTDIWAGGWICWEIKTDKVPFHEVNSAGAITLMVIQGAVPATRDDAQLAQVLALCSLMKDCWAFDPEARPNIVRCCTELKWIPSIPPSSGKASDSRAPSIELLLEMGKVHYKQARPEKAASLFQEALSLARSAGDQPATAKALWLLAHVYQLQNKYTQAEESCTRAQEIYVRVGDDWGQANTLFVLGDIYRLQSRYTQAEESYTRAQEIYGRVDNDQGQANTLLRLGHVYCAQFKYTQAEESYTRAQEIYALFGDDQGRANTVVGLGEVCRLQSKHTEAEGLYTRAQEIYARVGDDQGQANTLNGLGDIYRLQSNYTQAEESYTRAQDIYARLGNDQGQANALLRLGHVYSRPSKFTQAEESYTRAQEIYARVGNNLGRANVLLGLGNLQRKQGHGAEAALHYAEARDLFAQIGRTRDQEEAAHWLAVVSSTQNSPTA